MAEIFMGDGTLIGIGVMMGGGGILSLVVVSAFLQKQIDALTLRVKLLEVRRG